MATHRDLILANLAESAAKWDQAADALAKGGPASIAKAALCHRAAISLRMEGKTGRVHCACCLSPEKPETRPHRILNYPEEG